MMELAAEPLGGGRTNFCPRCRKDLTENVRTHLYGCAKLPAEVRLRAQALREAAQRLVRQSQELVDNADVRIREAETALFLAQHALRAEMRKRTKS
jgi:ribosome-binding protein aMBF1 (putative translation factor)